MEHVTTLLLDLPGVAVQRVVRQAEGARVAHVVTDDESAAACPACGVLSTSCKGQRITRPRDIPYGRNKVRLVWHTLRWRCAERGCPRGSFTEQIEQVPAYARVTRRCRDQIARRIGDENRSVLEVAAEHAVSWPTAHRAVVAYAEAVLGEPDPVQVLGIEPHRPAGCSAMQTTVQTAISGWLIGGTGIGWSQMLQCRTQSGCGVFTAGMSTWQMSMSRPLCVVLTRRH